MRPARNLEVVEEEIRHAFELASIGDTLTICRWNCKTEDFCPMCARVLVVPDMTVDDVLKIATAHRA